MRMICPSCGACHSAEAWDNDGQARECIRLVAEMPSGVARRTLGYLAMFRPAGGRALQWRRALTLTSELKELVEAGMIQWDNHPARQNRPEFWSEGLERILTRPPKSLPLKNHNYLRSIAWDIANEVDRNHEVQENKKISKGVNPHRQGEQKPAGEPERISPEELKRITDDWRKRKAERERQKIG
jgi:hypothetical protein